MGLQENDLAGLAEGWRPEAGDVLIGEVTDVTKGFSDYTGDFYPIVVVKPRGNGDPVAVHAFHTSLRDKLIELRPEVGETIGVRCGERVKTKDGKREVQTYTVRIEGRSAPDPWGDFAPVARTATRTTETATATVAEDDIPF